MLFLQSEINSLLENTQDIYYRYYYLKPMWFWLLVIFTIIFVIYLVRFYKVNKALKNKNKPHEKENLSQLDLERNSIDVTDDKNEKKILDDKGKFEKFHKRFLLYLSMFIFITYINLINGSRSIRVDLTNHRDEIIDVIEELEQEESKEVKEESLEEKTSDDDMKTDKEEQVEEGTEDKNKSKLSKSEFKRIENYMNEMKRSFEEELDGKLSMDVKYQVDDNGFEKIVASITPLDDELNVEIVDNIEEGLFPEAFKEFESALEILSGSYYKGIPIMGVGLDFKLIDPINEDYYIYRSLDGETILSFFITE